MVFIALVLLWLFIQGIFDAFIHFVAVVDDDGHDDEEDDDDDDYNNNDDGNVIFPASANVGLLS